MSISHQGATPARHSCPLLGRECSTQGRGRKITAWLFFPTQRVRIPALGKGQPLDEQTHFVFVNEQLPAEAAAWTLWFAFTFSTGSAKPPGDAPRSPPWPLCVCCSPELWFVGKNFAGTILWSSQPSCSSAGQNPRVGAPLWFHPIQSGIIAACPSQTF